MKKFLSALLTAVMLLSIAAPAWAEDSIPDIAEGEVLPSNEQTVGTNYGLVKIAGT